MAMNSGLSQAVSIFKCPVELAVEVLMTGESRF